MDRMINGAVGFGARVYRAGDEDALLEALDGEAPAKHLTSGDAPVLSGTWTGKAKRGSAEPADYDGMKVGELQALAEQRGVEVKPTGANGAVKADYVAALEQADKAKG